ncbi:MAG: hypothetical protein NC189_00445 [Bacteroides sp.]|nr:hypothetical protein [Bacteroides sp.]
MKNHILALTVLLASGACSDSSSDGPTLSLYTNIVTFKCNDTGKAVFEFQEINDSPVVRLETIGMVNESQAPPGTRLLMAYSLPEGVAYGTDCTDIQVRALQTIFTDTVSALPSPIAKPAPIYLITLYRTGNYLNFTASMPHLPSRKYFITAEQESLDTDTAQLYLSTRVPEEKPTFNSTQTGSVDISPVWNLPGVKAVKVHVNNTNNVYRTSFIFPKQNQTTTQK